MPNFAVKNTDINDTVNYLLAGNTGIGQAMIGYWNGDGGYLNASSHPPYIQTAYPSAPMPFDQYIYTPAYTDVEVTDNTDRILITAQARPFIEWTATDPSTDFNWYLSIERQDLPYFTTITELAQDNNSFTGNVGNPGVTSIGDTIFVGVIDSPGIGNYRYSLTSYLRLDAGDPVVASLYLENLGITTTLIKR
jgi:hypothetical protein